MADQVQISLGVFMEVKEGGCDGVSEQFKTILLPTLQYEASQLMISYSDIHPVAQSCRICLPLTPEASQCT